MTGAHAAFATLERDRLGQRTGDDRRVDAAGEDQRRDGGEGPAQRAGCLLYTSRCV